MAQQERRKQCDGDGNHLSLNFARTNPQSDGTNEAPQTGVPLQPRPAAERHADAAEVGVVNLAPDHACRRVREELRPRVSPILEAAPPAACLKQRRREASGNGFRAIDQDQRARFPQEVAIGRAAFDVVRRRFRDRRIARLRAT